MHEAHEPADHDVMDLLKRKFPRGATQAVLRRYLHAVARAANDLLDDEGPCPGGMTLCGDGITCVHDPVDCP